MPGIPVIPDDGRLEVARFQGRIGLRTFGERTIKGICFSFALVSVITTLGIIYVLISQSLPFFTEVSPTKFLSGTVWAPTPEPGKFGVIPLVTGTLMITVGSGIISIPLGLLSAIFMSEYAPKRLRGLLKPLLELLAGIPTVVYGYFGLFVVTPVLKQFIPGIESSNALSGAIVVGIMILPLVSSLCEDALTAVPHSLREAAYGLGATKTEVTTRTVLPAALSGVMASFILALSRAFGETMAVTLAAGSNPVLTFNPTKAIETMTAYIVSTSKGDAGQGTIRYNSIFAVGVMLFFLTMVMNVIAHRLVKKFRQVYS